MVAVDPTVVKLGGQTYVWDASTMKVKTLFQPGNSLTGSSCHDSEDAADYQVPTAKKFVALEITTTIQIDFVKTQTLYSSTAADSQTGQSNKLSVLYPADANMYTNPINVNIEFAVDLFVTVLESTLTGQEPRMVIVGIEMDA